LAAADAASRRGTRVPVMLSASYTSTVAEELCCILRTLHAMDGWWSQLINEYIITHLPAITRIFANDKFTSVSGNYSI